MSNARLLLNLLPADPPLVARSMIESPAAGKVRARSGVQDCVVCGLSALLTELHAATIRQALTITADTPVLLMMTAGIADAASHFAIGVHHHSSQRPLQLMEER